MRCLVDGISHQGEGVARINGKAVFIPHALPGEELEIEIVEERSRYSRGRIAGIYESSPERTATRCPHYYDCGGCAYQHVEYSRELELKRQVVRDNLLRIGHIDKEVKPVLGLSSPWLYRNKVSWHLSGDGEHSYLAYYRGGSHDWVKITDCRLISRPMQEASHYLNQMLPAVKFKPGATAVIRQSAVDDSLMLILYGLLAAPPKAVIDQLSKNFASLYFSRGDDRVLAHAGGAKYLEGRLGEVKCRLSPESFFQVNQQQADRMIEIIKEQAGLSGSQAVLDAYCGTGTIALNMASRAASVTGIESNQSAIEDAKFNARSNNIHNADFITGNCEKVLPSLNQSFDLVILDPPRSGCQEQVIDAVITGSPARIIYVSCNPSTLARDLARFKQSGYSAVEVQPVDMFPRTYHVECVTLMSRVKE